MGDVNSEDSSSNNQTPNQPTPASTDKIDSQSLPPIEDASAASEDQNENNQNATSAVKRGASDCDVSGQPAVKRVLSEYTCEACDTDTYWAVRCPSETHYICRDCIKDAIKELIRMDQVTLMCPVYDCQREITLEILSTLQPSVTVELFTTHIYKKQIAQSEQAIPLMPGMVSCPKCSWVVELPDRATMFQCPNDECGQFCRYCKASWPVYTRQDVDYLAKRQTLEKEHSGCGLLQLPGKSLTDLEQLPDHWASFPEEQYKNGYVSVPLFEGSSEYQNVVAFYRKTSTCRVTAIARIQHPKCWRKYAYKRRHMLQDLHEDNLMERLLFFTGSEKAIINVCEEGFDCRKPSYFVDSFGKGIYFCTNASTMESSQSALNEMVLASVLCGRSAVGHPSIQYPPYDYRGRMFDSCVNVSKDPTWFVLFSNEQTYPSYLLQFSR